MLYSAIWNVASNKSIKATSRPMLFVPYLYNVYAIKLSSMIAVAIITGGEKQFILKEYRRRMNIL